MAKDKICRPFVGIIAPENKFTVDTIDDLKSRNYLTIGDIVDLNGYYTAGDGAHHKRKIESTDDGSGVQLANGLWANIVHSGEVNVSWFGAKGDGVTDDFAHMNKCFDFGKKNKLLVFLDSENYLCKGSFEIGENTNIQGLGREHTVLKFDSFNSSFAFGALDNSYGVELKDFTILGAGKTNQEKIKGIYISNSSTGDAYGLLQNLRIEKFSDDGIYIHTNVREIRVINCVSGDNGGNGINANCNDSFFETCTTWGNLKNGIRASRGELRFIGCKSWYNGQDTTSNYTNFQGESATELTIDSCTFQESYVHGVLIGGCRAVNISNTTFSFNGFINKGVSHAEAVKTYHLHLEACDQVNISNVMFTSKKLGVGTYTKRCIYLKGNTGVRIIGAIQNDSELENEEQVVFGDNNHANAMSTLEIDLNYNLKPQKYKKRAGVNLVKNGDISERTADYFTNAILDGGKILTSSKNVGFQTIDELQEEQLFAYARIKQVSGPATRVNLEYTGSVWTDGTTNSEYLLVSQQFACFKGTPKKFYLQITNEDAVFQILEVGATYGMFGGTNLPMHSKAITTNFMTLLNTPYYTLKMQQQGVYEDFISYMDSQHEYDKEQKALETAKQEAYQLALANNSELVYEDWLASYPELMPVHQEPVPSEALQAFYNEYK